MCSWWQNNPYSQIVGHFFHLPRSNPSSWCQVSDSFLIGPWHCLLCLRRIFSFHASTFSFCEANPGALSLWVSLCHLARTRFASEMFSDSDKMFCHLLCPRSKSFLSRKYLLKVHLFCQSNATGILSLIRVSLSQFWPLAGWSRPLSQKKKKNSRLFFSFKAF